MTFHIVEPNGSITVPAGHGIDTTLRGTDNKTELSQGAVKISLNTESLTTLLRSNISCHLNKTMTQELMNELVAQIIESIDYFINKTEENL